MLLAHCGTSETWKHSCFAECRCDQIGAVLSGYSISHYLPRKEIKNHTDIQIFVIDFKVSHNTDPDSVGFVCLKLSLEEVCKT